VKHKRGIFEIRPLYQIHRIHFFLCVFGPFILRYDLPIRYLIQISDLFAFSLLVLHIFYTRDYFLKNTLIVVQQQTRVKSKDLCDYFLNEWTDAVIKLSQV
jgi:hypothetical protein